MIKDSDGVEVCEGDTGHFHYGTPFNTTLEWKEPSQALVGWNRRDAEFIRIRLIDLVEGIIANARDHGEARVEIHVRSFNPKTAIYTW